MSEPGEAVVHFTDLLDGGGNRDGPVRLFRVADAAGKNDARALAGHGDVGGIHVARDGQCVRYRRFQPGRVGTVEMFGRFALEGTFLEDHVALLLLGVCRKTRDEPVCSLRLKERWALLAIGGLAPKMVETQERAHRSRVPLRNHIRGCLSLHGVNAVLQNLFPLKSKFFEGLDENLILSIAHN